MTDYAARLSTQAQRTALAVVANYALHVLGRKTLATLGPNSLRPSERLYLAELVPSTVHSVLLASAATYFVFGTGMFAADMVEEYDSEPLDWILAFSAGYSIHDSVVCWLHKEHLTMYAHHIAMAFGAFGMSVYKRGALAPLFFYVSEWSVPVQNALYLAEKTQASRSTVRALLVLRLAMFLVFRTAQLPSFIYVLQSRGIPFVDSMRRLHWLPAGGIINNVVLISILNIIWTVAVVRRTAPVLRELLLQRKAKK